MRPRAWLLGVALCGITSACGADSEPTPETNDLDIWNRSAFELRELKVHSGLAGHVSASNELSEPLLDEHGATVSLETGQYVTVVREKVENGELIAFTTAEPPNVDAAGHTLVVYQESFRLLKPGQSP